MSELKQEKWVAGVVNTPQDGTGKDFPFTFFEIDTDEPNVDQQVLNVYKRFNLDVVSQRIGKGYHYFGNQIDRAIWREWYAELKNLNPLYPPLTLRITKKFIDEVFEKPVYHEAQNVIPNWAKALMHFLNKEIRGQNDTNLYKATQACSLQKYFRVVVYKVNLQQKLGGMVI